MILTIEKTDFERILPAGKSAHESVFENILPAIEEQKIFMEFDYLGTEGIELMESNETLQFYVKKCVCVSAFLSVLRQLDLVLTQSGFGIVSSDKVAPASKQRVDALEGHLRTVECKSYGTLMHLLRSEKWGKTAQAVQNLRYLFNQYEFFRLYHEHPSYQDWNNFLPTLQRFAVILRKKIGDKQMEALLDAYRCNNTDVYTTELKARVFRFVYSLMNEGEATAIVYPLFAVVEYLDSHLDIYTEWANSKEYEAFHHEGFKNASDNTAFFFG